MVFVSFDLVGTLVGGDFFDKVWIEGIPRYYAETEGLSLEEAKKRVFKEYMKVGDEKLEWYFINYWLEKFSLDVDYKEIFEAYRGNLIIYDDVPYVLEKLKKLNVKLVVLTRTAREFIDFCLQDFSRFFYKVYSSTSDFNETRKTVSFYRVVCKKLSVSPFNLYHIGDDLKEDYINPRKIGVKSFYLVRNHKKHEELRKKIKEELKELGNAVKSKHVFKDLKEFLHYLEISF